MQHFQMTDQELISEMQARKEICLTLSRLYGREIDEELLEALKGSVIYETDDEKLNEGLDLMRNYLASDEATELELAKDYAKTFCGAGSTNKSSAFPFESVFTSERQLLMQEARDDVLINWYHRFGLGKSENWKDCEDHIALELEFEAFLIGKFIEAVEAQQDQEAIEYLQAQKEFIETHLLNWVPEFTVHVDHRAQTDFYRGLALFALAYLKQDYAALSDFSEEISAA